mgnify:CR=1 FL=1
MELLVRPMREELTSAGFRELRTPEEVDQFMRTARGTVLLFVNSMCGCAGSIARPAVIRALQEAGVRPEHLVTVFAGQDREATARARAYLEGCPPSSPSMFVLKDGRVVFALQRHQIEGRTAQEVAQELVQALESWARAG